MDIPNASRGHLVAGRKIRTIPTNLKVGKVPLLRLLAVASQIIGRTVSARTLIDTKPVPLAAGRQSPSSFCPSLTGLNGGLGGRTVFSQ